MKQDKNVESLKSAFKNFNGCFVVSWEDIKPSEVWQDKLVKKIYEVSFPKRSNN